MKTFAKQKSGALSLLKSRAGFTLIELMVALAVAGIGASVIVQGMTAFGQMYRRYRQVLDAQTNWRLGGDLLQPLFAMSGFGLTPSSNAENDSVGSQAIDDSKVASDHELSLYGNYNDVYAKITEIGDDKLTLELPPTNADDRKFKSLSLWNTAEAFSQGDNTFVAVGRRDPATEKTSSVYVYNVTGLENSKVLKIAEPPGGAGVGPELNGGGEAFIDSDGFSIGCEIIKRTVVTPLIDEEAPGQTTSLKMTADPEQPPIPVVDNVVGVDVLNLDTVQRFIADKAESANSMPRQWQQTMMLLRINTRTAQEFTMAKSAEKYDERGRDLDGDPTNGRAQLRRGTIPIVFPNNMMVSTSLRYHYLDFRHAQITLYCAQNPDDCS